MRICNRTGRSIFRAILYLLCFVTKRGRYSISRQSGARKMDLSRSAIFWRPFSPCRPLSWFGQSEAFLYISKGSRGIWSLLVPARRSRETFLCSWSSWAGDHMEAIRAGNIDTGPGLEAHVSWDYSHSNGLADVLAHHEACQAINKLQAQRNQNNASHSSG